MGMYAHELSANSKSVTSIKRAKCNAIDRESKEYFDQRVLPFLCFKNLIPPTAQKIMTINHIPFIQIKWEKQFFLVMVSTKFDFKLP